MPTSRSPRGSESVPDCNGTVDVSNQSAATSDDSGSASAADPALLGDVLWIGGALVAVVAAVGVTLLLLRRRPQS
ncbi:hypothetical protein Q0F99_03540 [Rathayibacter oskolensis]|uniref:hypothetical protein n=1 Tax=Rathayibacter oskolensis TaxID=1891671 RepID=UPI00265FE5C4|nr:hypothetical protein [Rathayibacter oskolensis]WKK72127.1 hypothetical protein Q0F99_03540 [Rathayibacter oskolensis]